MIRSLAIVMGLSGIFMAAVAGGHARSSEPAANLHQLVAHVTADVRSFYSRRLQEKVVRYCSSQMRQCGKVIADGFCRSEGFEEAFTFQRGKDQIDQTTSFRQIKC